MPAATTTRTAAHWATLIEKRAPHTAVVALTPVSIVARHAQLLLESAP